MPASFRLNQGNIEEVLRELKQVEPGLVAEFRKEFRKDLAPFANRLKTNIPPTSPISGFNPRTPSANSPYIFKKPTAKIDVDFRPRRRRRGEFPVVRILFNDRRPNAGFSILETAGTRGVNRLSKALTTAGFPLGDRGRWVIPQFYENKEETASIARTILDKYATKVNRKLRVRG
jgi:hypothetical protein